MYGCDEVEVPGGPLSFCRFPSVSARWGPEMKALVQKRRTLWFSRMNRSDVVDPDRPSANDHLKTQLDSVRVCGRHFVSGMNKYIHSFFVAFLF